jgi:hypothetical protein
VAIQWANKWLSTVVAAAPLAHLVIKSTPAATLGYVEAPDAESAIKKRI